jgi:hypothetical protein
MLRKQGRHGRFFYPPGTPRGDSGEDIVLQRDFRANADMLSRTCWVVGLKEGESLFRFD